MELAAQGKQFLRQYLSDCGVEIIKRGSGEWLKCINPDHPDNNPSCSFIPESNGTWIHCFSCGFSGDIYRAATALEDKPSSGLPYIRENIEYILTKYSIPFEPIEFTEEQLETFRYDSLYETVFKLMVATNSDTSLPEFCDLKYAQQRGWNSTTCAKLGIGSVKNFDKFIEALSNSTRIPKEDLQKMGIRRSLFGPDYLTFCIKDYDGSVKGVVARYINWTKGSDTPKYDNTGIEENPNYHKDELLYCSHIAGKYKSLRLDIFEGYGSAVTAHQENYHNCVALGGTALTTSHIELIRSLGFTHINLVLDQDKTGTKKMQAYMEKFSGYNGLRVTTMDLPFSEEDRAVEGQNDPDFFIRKYGIGEYRKLKPVGVFEHMIKKHGEEIDPDSNPSFTSSFTKSMIKLILNEEDLVERSQMINTLSKYTRVEKEDIRAELQRLTANDVNKLRDDLTKKLKRVGSVDDLQSILDTSLYQIENSSTTKKDRHLISVVETVEFFDDVFQEMNSYKEGIHGWVTGFTALDNKLDGIPKPLKAGRAIAFAGASQHGKSAILLNVALQVALNNKDAAICYWAIDDNRKSIAYRLISMISGVPMKKILNNVKRSDDDVKAMKMAQDILRQLTTDRKLVFKDDKFGRNIARAESWIKDTQDATGNHIMFCIDSLHNVKNESDSDSRIKVLTSSTWAKSLTARVPATVLMTLEMVKNRIAGQKPNMISISETVKIEFDMDTIGIVWNEAVGSFTSVDNPTVKAKWGHLGIYKPIIELDIQKNKSGAGERGSVYFKYDNETTAIVGCSSTLDCDNPPLENLSYGNTNLKFDVKTEDVETDTGW